MELVLTAADFTQHPSKTLRLHFFTVLRDAWQIRPAMHVRFSFCWFVHILLTKGWRDSQVLLLIDMTPFCDIAAMLV